MSKQVCMRAMPVSSDTYHEALFQIFPKVLTRQDFGQFKISVTVAFEFLVYV